MVTCVFHFPWQNSYQRLHPQTPPTLSANCRLQWHCESPPLGCDHRFEPTEPSGPPSQWFSLWCHAVCTKIDGVCKCIETDVNPTNNDGSHGFEPLKWFFLDGRPLLKLVLRRGSAINCTALRLGLKEVAFP